MSSNGTPAFVRATEPVIDEGLVYALAGDVGEVLDVGDLDDGGRWVMVQFSNAPEPTMCFLGADVEPMLTVVSPAPNEPRQAPTPSPLPAASPRRRRRTGMRRAVAAAAAVLVGVVWCAAEDQPEEFAAVEVQTPSGLGGEPILVDVDSGSWRPLQSGQRLPAPDDAPSDWRREPCPRDPRVRTIDGLCFLAYGKPPCGVGYENRGECVVPVAKGKPLPSSIRR